jgi:hypothetical protein
MTCTGRHYVPRILLLSGSTRLTTNTIHESLTLASSAVISPETPVALKSRTEGDPCLHGLRLASLLGRSTAYPNYDYNVLTHIAYFSYEVDTATGVIPPCRGWDTTPQ